MGHDSRAYYKKWYKENAEQLNQRRRIKYREDRDYRSLITQRNARARRARQEVARKERILAREAIKTARPESQWRTYEVEIDGVLVRLFSVGALAKALERSLSTIREWEDNGLIPATPYRSPEGLRLYTIELIEQIRRSLWLKGKINVGGRPKRLTPLHVVREVEFKDGQRRKVRLYKVGTLAAAVDRSLMWPAKSEKRGILPRTPFLYTSVKHRLYTIEMIEVVRDSLEARGGELANKHDRRAFTSDVYAGWTELGVMDARLVE